MNNIVKILRRIRVVIRPSEFQSTVMNTSQYQDWTKDQLIAKIGELEGNQLKQGNKGLKNFKSVTNRNICSTNKKKIKKSKPFAFENYETRFIALRFAYLGWNYNGLAIQKDPTPLPTVEGVIIEAMNKCKLVPSMNPQEFKFSRCGRTDKGVSAMNQVISLNVRSNLTKQEQADPKNDSKELPYVTILNQLLPEDIRVSAVCLRPPQGFDARFSCEYRHYKYLFDPKGLDLEKMKIGAKLYEGEHDFRNFCKLDGSKQITNFCRTILSANIEPVTGTSMYCFDLVGSAFLWHQVRCMVAILFLVGQKLEDPQLISNMLDINITPCKPIYEMASDLPLLLYDCKFSDMEWLVTSSNDYKTLKFGKAVYALSLQYKLKSTAANILNQNFSVLVPNILQDKTCINLGDGKGKVVTKYEKIMKRQVMDPVDVVNQNYRAKKQKMTDI